jgi:uncharacterized membrane protein YqaE (UPF0057 family)
VFNNWVTRGSFRIGCPFLKKGMTIEIVLIMILLPIFAFYGGFMIGGLIFAIYKEIRAINERRNPKK